MKELVVISGKGGTGKTTLAGAFAVLAEEAVLADCDVDAANLGLILSPTVRETHDFTASRQAVIRAEVCTGCGRCAEVCRMDAVREVAGGFEVNGLSCEGCGVCRHLCPADAIELVSVLSGRWFVSDTEFGPLVHARLGPGEENSGKLVTVVRGKARDLAREREAELIIIDGPPGIGCPVVASLSGVTAALVVTEPSLSAMSDMERVLDVAHHFSVPAAVVVNRADVDDHLTARIERSCADRGVEVLGRIPYDPAVIQTLVQGRTAVAKVVGHDGPGRTDGAPRAIRELWSRLNTSGLLRNPDSREMTISG